MTKDFLQLHNLVGPSKTNLLATVTAIYDIGCFVGALIAFTIGERLGRKKAIIMGTVIMSVGTLIKCTSYSLAQMFVGRIVLGYVINPTKNQYLLTVVELEMVSIPLLRLSGKPKQPKPSGVENSSS